MNTADYGVIAMIESGLAKLDCTQWLTVVGRYTAGKDSRLIAHGEALDILLGRDRVESKSSESLQIEPLKHSNKRIPEILSKLSDCLPPQGQQGSFRNDAQV